MPKKNILSDRQAVNKDGEVDLHLLVNQHWKNAAFGYPIHPDVRIPITQAEILAEDARKSAMKGRIQNPNSEWHSDKDDRIMYNAKNPLIEYERLFDLWEKEQVKIREHTKYAEYEFAYRKKHRQVMDDYEAKQRQKKEEKEDMQRIAKLIKEEK